MKLLSYLHQGRQSWGRMTERGIIDGGKLSKGRYSTIRAVLEADALAEISALSERAEPTLQISEIEFLPVIPDPENIFCVGLNYEDHRIEVKREPTGAPALFLRNRRSQVGHAQPIVKPRESESLDFEGEIAVVISKSGRRIMEADAFSHIAGYAAYNDGSIRDWQRQTTQWTAGKNFERTGAFGPCMTTRDEIGENEALTLETRLNGVVMQRASTDMLVFSIPKLIAHISTLTTLLPGDVIVTGTPGGVGVARQPPLFMKAGDVVEVEVAKVGVLRNIIQGE